LTFQDLKVTLQLSGRASLQINFTEIKQKQSAKTVVPSGTFCLQSRKKGLSVQLPKRKASFHENASLSTCFS